MRGDERCCDRVQVEVPRRLVRTHADRRRARAQDQRFVEEPRRADEDDLITGIEHGRHRERHRAVRAAREEDVVGLEGDAQLIAELGCGRLRGTRIRHPVREPASVLRLEPLLEGLDVAGERRDLRVAGEEVAGIGVAHERSGSHDPAQEGRERGLDTHLPLGDRHALDRMRGAGIRLLRGRTARGRVDAARTLAEHPTQPFAMTSDQSIDPLGRTGEGRCDRREDAPARQLGQDHPNGLSARPHPAVGRDGVHRIEPLSLRNGDRAAPLHVRSGSRRT